LLVTASIPSLLVLSRIAFTLADNVANRGVCHHSEEHCDIGCFDGRLNRAHSERTTTVNRKGELRFRDNFSLRLAGGAAALLPINDRDFVLRQIFTANAVGLARGCPLKKVKLYAHFGCAMLASVTAPGAELDMYDATTRDGLFVILEEARRIVIEAWAEKYPGQPIAVEVYVTLIERSPLGAPTAAHTPHPSLVHA
jgi:hypothetical protein